MKKLIITADDFGASRAVNKAVETAHREGVLNTASLMVVGEAAADAVDRARRMPDLRVGLHLSLVNARPLSPPREIPDLVDSGGCFDTVLFRAGVRFFFRPGVRAQLLREVRAQFEAFRSSGLRLDHVNCHNHMHLHPTIGRLLVRAGAEYGMRAVRYPYEAPGRSSLTWLMPWFALLKRSLAKNGVRSNQFVFGLNESGRMSLDGTLRFIRNLPAGVTEIYFHPGADGGSELSILTSPLLRKAIEDSGAELISFSDL